MTGTVRLRNGRLSLAIRAEVGCEIVELVDLASGTNMLGRSPWGVLPASQQTFAGSSADFWAARTAGGWNLLFPHAGAEREEDGGLRTFHGEAGTASWRITEVTAHRAAFSTVLFGTPFELTRVIELDGDAVTVTDRARNQSPDAVAVSWGHHPTFGEPFLEPGVRLEIGAATVEVGRPSIGEPAFAEGTRGSWPVLEGTDLSVVPPADAPRALLAYLSELDEGRYRLLNDRLGLGIELTWELDLFPHAWLWQELHASPGAPWFRRAYLMAIEPHSTIPEGGAPTIDFAGGQSRESVVTARLIVP